MEKNTRSGKQMNQRDMQKFALDRQQIMASAHKSFSQSVSPASWQALQKFIASHVSVKAMTPASGEVK